MNELTRPFEPAQPCRALSSAPEPPTFQEMIPLITGNPYIDKGVPLLILLTTLPDIERPASIATYQRHLLSALTLYSKSLSEKNAKRATFILAATLDEKNFQAPWCGTAWSGETLCSRLFKRRDAGRQYFQIVKEWLKSPDENVEPLMLVYLCLKLGFKGQFRYKNRDALDSLQVSLHHLLLQKGQLNKHLLDFESPEKTTLPPYSIHYRRFALIFISLFSGLVITGAAAMFSQRTFSLEYLRQAFLNTSYSSGEYQRVKPEAINELIYPKGKY